MRVGVGIAPKTLPQADAGSAENVADVGLGAGLGAEKLGGREGGQNPIDPTVQIVLCRNQGVLCPTSANLYSVTTT